MKYFIIIILIVGCKPELRNYLESKTLDCLNNAPKNIDIFEFIDSCVVGSYIHDFDLQDINNINYTLNFFKSPILINYWFIGCKPCEVEKKYLQKISHLFPHIKIISISLNDEMDTRKYVIEHKLPAWIYIHNMREQKVFQNTLGFPLTIIVTPVGKIIKFYSSGIQNENIFNDVVKFLHKNN